MKVTSYGALKATQFMTMAFSIGMAFFPAKMMEGYKADVVAGEAGTVLMFMMGFFGLGQLSLSIVCASVARSTNEKARSVG